MAIQRVREAAEKAKIELSTSMQVQDRPYSTMEGPPIWDPLRGALSWSHIHNFPC